MRGITKEFSGVKALVDINLNVRSGEIHALVGENGAGKSTLMNILSGIYPYGSYEGDIIYKGELSRFASIPDSERRGIAIIHQELALVPQLSIGENIFLGNECNHLGVIDWDLTHRRASTLLETVGLEESPLTLIRDIGVGKQQLVEIAKALSKDVDLLILDEPTAALNDEDSQRLLDLLKRFREKGMTCILISHKLSEVEQVSDAITVLRDGTTIETLSRESGDINEQRIIKSMVGREITDRFPKRTSDIGDVVFEIRDWSASHPLYDRTIVDKVTLNVREKEVVGISGLMGAGRSELAMSVFGHLYGREITGEVFVRGKKVELRDVSAAIAQNVAYVTEDRKTSGLILSNPIRTNTTLADLARVSAKGVIDEDIERNLAMEFSAKLGVKCKSNEQNVESLSGGNQQKVLLSKWMFTEPDILILDEPTRGIDVGAKYEIYLFINRLVEEGKSLLMISSEMPELLGMCDRIYVMDEGRIVAEFTQAEASPERIMTSIIRSRSHNNNNDDNPNNGHRPVSA
jgi:putative multiple sugar transport system ATP-binding protein